jgi:hypothetical protein
MLSNLETSVSDQATDRSAFIDRTHPLKPVFMIWCLWPACRWWSSGKAHPLANWVDDMFSTLTSPEYMCSLAARPSRVNNFVLERWCGCLTVWITGTWRTVLEMTHSSGCTGNEAMPITIVPRRFMDYKYLFRLALIAILHFFTFSLRIFLSHSPLMNNGR